MSLSKDLAALEANILSSLYFGSITGNSFVVYIVCDIFERNLNVYPDLILINFVGKTWIWTLE
jgi:hypothetical protein